MAKRKAKRKPPREPRLDRARVEEVLRLRLDGAQLHDVLTFANVRQPDATEPPWNLTDAQAVAYVRAADELIAARRDRDANRVAALHLAQRNTLLARAINGADYRTALACLQDMGRLEGLYTKHAQERDELLKIATLQQQAIVQLEAEVADLRAGRLLPAVTVTDAAEDRPEETVGAARGEDEGRGTETEG